MNYPNGKKHSINDKKVANKSRLGMSLENDINISNKFYLDRDLAVIHKKPTPITIVKVDFPARSRAKITEAYFKLPSTTDYNGIFKGKYIDFEAKECNSDTSFPFTSIKAHQIKHLENVLKHGAIAFLIIRMSKFDEDYLINAKEFISFYRNASRKSLPYEWIKENGYLISSSYQNPCDYLSVVEKVYKL